MISLKDVSMIFHPGTDREVRAVDGISFDLDAGNWFTVVGPNGSGKSTLLRLLSGALQPTGGEVLFDGKDISTWPQYRRASFIQHIEQDTDANLVPSMTVEENLVLAFSRWGAAFFSMAITNERRARICRCLAEFGMGLESQTRRQVRSLSGGQRAAVVIAKAILQQTKVLLLDEITASLDPHTAPLLLSHVMELVKSTSLSAVMVTHDMEEALKCRRDVLFLNRGRIHTRIPGHDLTADVLRDLFAQSILSSVEAR